MVCKQMGQCGAFYRVMVFDCRGVSEPGWHRRAREQPSPGWISQLRMPRSLCFACCCTTSVHSLSSQCLYLLKRKHVKESLRHPENDKSPGEVPRSSQDGDTSGCLVRGYCITCPRSRESIRVPGARSIFDHRHIWCVLHLRSSNKWKILFT